jgi:aerobic carbon-monoxide dehydrogenase large subunit
MGEGGAIGSPAAVANAVGDALAHLGVSVTKTPLGPNDIHRLLVEGGRDDQAAGAIPERAAALLSPTAVRPR